MNLKTETQIETKFGALVVTVEDWGGNFPGVCIDLHRDGYNFYMPVAYIESVEADGLDKRLHVVVWGDGEREDCTHDITVTNIDKYFEEGN